VSPDLPERASALLVSPPGAAFRAGAFIMRRHCAAALVVAGARPSMLGV